MVNVTAAKIAKLICDCEVIVVTIAEPSDPAQQPPSSALAPI
jgi:hypothetical protein